MADADLINVDAESVKRASEYRARLKAEIASVDAFLAMAEELSSPRKLAELGFWLWDESEIPTTLH